MSICIGCNMTSSRIINRSGPGRARVRPRQSMNFFSKIRCESGRGGVHERCSHSSVKHVKGNQYSNELAASMHLVQAKSIGYAKNRKLFFPTWNRQST